ncbi:MAG: Na/Pi cotransporter family protein [Lachnospiraceae bacterium]|nr:Na/Pi cotransporter family protein [Lachnospiraceae bacterium]
MDIFGVLTMLGGLALFLFGMDVMGDGLEKASGGRLERILEKLTSNMLMAVLLGAGVTAVIQSSSATTVMVVGFVNSGIMKLEQAVGIIMGTNVGTTMTAWLLSLTGLEGGSFIMKMLKPSSFAPILAVIGIIFTMFMKKNEQKKNLGAVLLGFMVLMTGMDMMSGAVKPLANVPEFTALFTMFSNPIIGLLVGAFVTAVIQSSSASVGILQALSATGAITFGSALPIIMGQNIGTCATALISGLGANKNARRTSLVHLYFNVVGTVVFLIVFYALNSFIHFEFMNGPATAVNIAIIHTVFNLFATVILLPFSDLLVKMACATIKDDPVAEAEPTAEENAFRLLDPRFLATPGYAVDQCKLTAIDMAKHAKDGLLMSLDLLENFDADKAKRVKELEDLVDRYEDELGSYMVKLSHAPLSKYDNHTISLLLHSIGDLERISDHSMNILSAAEEMHEKGMVFSNEGKGELKVFVDAVREILDLTVSAFEKNDTKRAAFVEPLEEVVDELNTMVKANHIKRLQKGICTIEQGFVLSDISTNLERVSDHCSNIAISVIEIDRDGFDAHGYLENLKKENDPQFTGLVESYRRKYALPTTEAAD